MDVKNRIAVVTGAASGIGKALCLALHEAGAKKVVCADLNGAGAEETAGLIGGVGHALDVGSEDQIKALIEQTEAEVGPIDLFVSNAGIIHRGGLEVPNEDWQHHSALRCLIEQ